MFENAEFPGLPVIPGPEEYAQDPTQAGELPHRVPGESTEPVAEAVVDEPQPTSSIDRLPLLQARAAKLRRLRLYQALHIATDEALYAAAADMPQVYADETASDLPAYREAVDAVTTGAMIALTEPTTDLTPLVEELARRVREQGDLPSPQHLPETDKVVRLRVQLSAQRSQVREMREVDPDDREGIISLEEGISTTRQMLDAELVNPSDNEGGPNMDTLERVLAGLRRL